jgi:hypothetical protein
MNFYSTPKLLFNRNGGVMGSDVLASSAASQPIFALSLSP